VRAKIIALPKEGDPSSAFTLAHEEIPTWARPDGGKGMHAMEMPFPVGKGVSLQGLAPGDKVEILVRQYTGGSIPYEVVGLKKLPADTALKLAE
jgi:Cu/Ag efflux protein CusF